MNFWGVRNVKSGEKGYGIWDVTGEQLFISGKIYPLGCIKPGIQRGAIQHSLEEWERTLAESPIPSPSLSVLVRFCKMVFLIIYDPGGCFTGAEKQ